MLGGVLDRLAARFGGDDGADDDAEDTRFVPSVLDESVRYAHGSSDAAVEREMAAIEEEARRLGEQRRDN